MTWWHWTVTATVILIVAWVTWWALAPLGNNHEP